MLSSTNQTLRMRIMYVAAYEEQRLAMAGHVQKLNGTKTFPNTINS